MNLIFFIIFALFFQSIPRASLIDPDEYFVGAITVDKNSTDVPSTNDTSEAIVGNLLDHIKNIASQTKISKTKLEEIEKVRNELKGSLGSEEIKVTEKQLKDAQAIRDVISKAVAMDDIVVAAPQSLLFSNFTNESENKTKTTIDNPDPFLASIKDANLLDKLLTKEKLEIIVNTIESSIARELEEQELPDSKMPSKFDEHFNQDISTLWHSNMPQNDRTYREVLQLTSVRESFKFKLGNNVIVWKMLYKKSLGRQTLIGRTDSDIILVSEEDEDYKLLQKIEFDVPITGMDVLVRWDDVKGSSENIVVLSLQNQVVWFKVSESLDNLEEVWRWNVNKEILMIHYFRMDNSDMLILVTESNTESSKASADIYEVDISVREFWIIQIIYLSVACDNVATLDTGRDFLISFPQNGTVIVYQFKMEVHGRGRFISFSNITSDGVTSVSGFQMGGHSYLAVGGYNPQVLRYHRGKLHPQTILSSSFGYVEQYMPIAARTYRDDLILLVQHRIYFETHSLSVLEALIWNGEAFNSAFSIPCYIGDVLVNFGITCMIDFERKQGIYGATVIQRGRNISLLVPRQDAPSGLFNLQLTLAKTSSPLSIELAEVKTLYDSIVKYLDFENDVIVSAMDSIENTPLPDKDNKFTGNWNIDTVYAKELQITNKVVIDPPVIHVGDKLWTQQDGHISIDILELAFEEQKHKLAEIENAIYQQRPRSVLHEDTNAPIHTFHPVPANGRFNIEGIHVLPREPFYNKRKITKRSVKLLGTVHAKNVFVENLDVAFLNDIPAEELVFSNGDLDFAKTLTVNGFLKCENVFLPDGGLVNNMDFSEQIERVNSHSLIDSVTQFEEVHVEENTQINGLLNGIPIDETRLLKTDENAEKINEFPEIISDLTINGKLTFDTINGIEWNSFIRSIVMTNLPIQLNDLVVHGDVIFDSPLQINTLNKMAFPDDFVWVHGKRESIIRGVKHFNSELKTFAIDCLGTINGFDPFAVITLDSQQYIPGEITFHHMEVSESLEINGTVTGKHLDDFVANPTLLHTNHVQSTCFFEHLEVEGDIIVENQMDDFILDEVLADVVYHNEPHTVINSFKTFEEATFATELEVTSNLINGINLKDFVTLDTDQELIIDKIHGNVMFNRLDLHGLFDFINITELDENSIKTFGDQYTEAELIFAPATDSEESYDLYADNLDINIALNDIPVDDYVSKDDEIILTGDFSFEDILAEKVVFETGSITTKNGLVNGVNLQEFDETRLSVTKPQTLTGAIYADIVEIHESVNVTFMNNRSMENINSDLHKILNISQILSTEDVYIDNLYVEGSVACNTVNGHDFQNIIENAIWLNKTNTIFGPMRFLDPIVINGDVTVESKLNSKPFEDFIANLVFKTDENIVIRGSKVFAQGFTVNGDLNTKKINNIPVEHLLTKYTTDIYGNVTLNGNVHITGPVTLRGNLNDIPMSYLEDVYKYDPVTKTHIIKDNFIINEPVHIDHLQVNGHLNDIPDVDSFFKNILLKHQDMNLTNEFIFKGLVHFVNGLNVEYMNDIYFNDFARNIILINNPTPTVIHEEVFFEAPIAFKEVLVTGDIYTNSISGCYIDEWMDNGIRIDQPILINSTTYFAPGTLSVENMKVVHLNKKPMKNVVTLHTDQDLDADIFCTEMFSSYPIQVDGFVNGLKLVPERENTLMTYGDQYIKGVVAFQNVRVLDSLTINGLVNKMNISNLATLDQDIYLRSPLSFKNITVNNLITEDKISGIDFDEWYQNALWRSGRQYQTVTGEWTIENACISEITGNEELNKEMISSTIATIENCQGSINSNINLYNENYQKLCYDLNNLVDKSQRQIYYFEYFESYINIYEGSQISTSFLFQYGNDMFIVVSHECYTSIYIMVHDDYQLIHHFETGFVGQWINVFDVNGDNYLVSTSGGSLTVNCVYSGTHIWKFNGTSITFVAKVGDFNLLHMIPSEYGVFYAMNSESHIVYEFDIQGKSLEEWSLPYEGGKYRFVPHDITLTLAVSDGKKLIILSSVRTRKVVNKRDDDAVEIISSNERTKRHFSKELIEKLSNVTSAIKKSRDRETLLGKSKLIELSLKRRNKNKFLTDAEKATTVTDDEIEMTMIDSSTNDYQTFDVRSGVTETSKSTPTVSGDTEIITSTKVINYTSASTIQSQYSSETTTLHNEKREDPAESTITTATSIPETTLKDDDTTETLKSRNIEATKTSSEIEESLTQKFMSALSQLFSGGTENVTKDAANNEVTTEVTDKTEETKISETLPKQNTSDDDLNDEDNNTKMSTLEPYTSKMADSTVRAENSDITSDNVLLGDLPSIKKTTETPFTKQTTLTTKGMVDTSSDTTQNIITVSTTQESYNSKFRNLPTTNEPATSTLKTMKDETTTERYIFVENSHQSYTASTINTYDPEKSTVTEKITSEYSFTFSSRNVQSTTPDDIYKSRTQTLPTTYETSTSSSATSIREKATTENTRLNEFFYRRFTTLSSASESDEMSTNSEKQKDFITQNIYTSPVPKESSTTKEPMKVMNEEVTTENNRLKELYFQRFTMTASEIESLRKSTDPNSVITSTSYSTTDKSGSSTVQPEDTTIYSEHVLNSQKKSHLIVNNRKQMDKSYMPIISRIPFVVNPKTTNYTELFLGETTTSLIVNESVTTSLPDETLLEPNIAQEIPLGGILIANNEFIPERDQGDIVMLTVGPKLQKKTLVAISSSKTSTIPGKHDVILIYEDILEGKLYQTLPCYKPSGLVAMNIGDETLLAFLEGENSVQIFTFKGIQGFAPLMQHKLHTTAINMGVLSYQEESKCQRYFLAITMHHEVELLEAKVNGNCGVTTKINCT